MGSRDREEVANGIFRRGRTVTCNASYSLISRVTHCRAAVPLEGLLCERAGGARARGGGLREALGWVGCRGAWTVGRQRGATGKARARDRGTCIRHHA